MTTLDAPPAVDAFADFTQVDELLDRAVVLEIAIRAGHLERRLLADLPDVLVLLAIQLWRGRILPCEEYADPARYLSEVYTDAWDAYLLHHRMRAAVRVVARLYGREEFLPALCERVDRLPHLPDADLLAEVLLCESAGGVL